MVEGNVDYFTMVYYFMNVVICIDTHLHVSFVLFCIIRYIFMCLYINMYTYIWYIWFNLE